jgi:trimethylamine:corrinoid methyltransferase-like protein
LTLGPVFHSEGETMARIECKLIREGGTVVELGGNTYHFAPASDAEGAPHVCDVKDDEHVDRFLAISEAYRLERKEPAVKGKAKPALAPVVPDDVVPQ